MPECAEQYDNANSIFNANGTSAIFDADFDFIRHHRMLHCLKVSSVIFARRMDYITKVHVYVLYILLSRVKPG